MVWYLEVPRPGQRLTLFDIRRHYIIVIKTFATWAGLEFQKKPGTGRQPNVTCVRHVCHTVEWENSAEYPYSSTKKDAGLVTGRLCIVKLPVIDSTTHCSASPSAGVSCPGVPNLKKALLFHHTSIPSGVTIDDDDDEDKGTT
jgi:hypothetical protein